MVFISFEYLTSSRTVRIAEVTLIDTLKELKYMGEKVYTGPSRVV
jgi:hypothetical protein